MFERLKKGRTLRFCLTVAAAAALAACGGGSGTTETEEIADQLGEETLEEALAKANTTWVWAADEYQNFRATEAKWAR